MHSKPPLPSPIFDTVQNFNIRNNFAFLKKINQATSLLFVGSDFVAASGFLSQYVSNIATFNSYRREIERILQWAWLIKKKSIREITRQDIEEYLSFCRTPPKEWISTTKVPRFIDETSSGCRLANPKWRPFVVSLDKYSRKKGILPDINKYNLSEKAFREIFTVLSSFYNFLIQEGTLGANPILQIRQKSRFIRKYQTRKAIRRLSDLQWKLVIKTAEDLASQNSEHERTLFIVTALYSMYLRISELVATDRWSPKMNSFKKDKDGNWWFFVIGKGNKERQIAVSDAMLATLARWRNHLGFPSKLPTPDEQFSLIPKNKGKGSITSTNQIRNIVQKCFDQTVVNMQKNGLESESLELQVATVHWLRHTGISNDVKIRPLEHVRDDAGHSSGSITDKYIDIELRERHQSAKNKKVIF